MRYLLAAVLLSTFCLPVAAAEWHLAKDDKGYQIRVFTRDVAGSDLKEFRGEMLLHSRLSALVALVEDTRRGPDWIFQCRALEVIESYSAQDKLLYMVTEAPWPVSDRDSVFFSHLSQSAENGTVRIDMEARPDAFPLSDDLLRISTMRGFWEFVPLGRGAVQVIYQVHAEPGGGIPSWLANSVVIDNPYYTLQKMAELVKSAPYRNAEVDHIREAD